MTTEQLTTTVIVADEGKVFRRKKSGVIYGKKVYLGYNYFDAGVGLSTPSLDVPDDFEEIDESNSDNSEVINQVTRLKRISELVENEKDNINSLNLTNEQALEVIEWFPQWTANTSLEVGMKVTYEGKLYETIQAHTTQEGWQPSLSTASLFKEIAQDVNMGTFDNPIPYDGNMSLENGKYYSQNNITYLCTRDTGIAVYNELKDLIGIYVTLAE